MEVVVQIQGRDALPVRAVPFAGRWQWMSSPDGIAFACSQGPVKTIKFETELKGGEKEVAVRNKEYLPSFVLLSDGAIRQLHPDEWSFYAVEIKGLEAKLRGEEKVEDGNFASWRRQAIETLPAGVFVWLDDFERWIADTCQPDCVEQEQDDDVVEEPTLKPVVPPDLQGTLFEGFYSSWPYNRRIDKPSFVSLKTALADWFETPFDDLPGEQWYRVKTDFWPMPWDELSPNQRRKVAAQWDCSHDPEAADERKRLWDLFCRQDALQREIREWEALKPQSITEKAEQTDHLLALREQERLLRVQLASDPAGSAQEDRAQQQGEAEAVTPTLSQGAVAAETEDFPKLGRKERQIMSIVECARSCGFEPLLIPRGGKQQIKERCLQETQLFTDSAFDDAWKQATQETPPRIRMKDHDMYGRRT